MNKSKLIIVLLLIICIFSIIFSITKGSLKLSPSEILHTILYEKGTMEYQILWNIRIPRIIIGCIVGMCLAVSGVILQGVMRNPLASPKIIGSSSGGGLGAFIIYILYPELYHLIPIAAFIGALGATLIIYSLAWKGSAEPMNLVLAGVGISSLLGACTNALMIFYPDRVPGTLTFMVGGLSAKTWPDLYMILPYAILGIVGSLFYWRKLNLLVLGDEIASGLGLNVEMTRIILIGISSLLAASAISTAGLLGFVGLIVPHISRLLVGSDYKYLLPASLILGGTSIVLCDTLARVLFDPIVIPVGLVMAFIGGPFFLYLLRERGKIT